MRRRIVGACLAALVVALPAMAQAQGISESFQVENFASTFVPGLPGNVTVVLMDDQGVETPILAESVPGLSAYNARPSFDARTGGANSNQELRNLSVTYTDGGNVIPTTYANDSGWQEVSNQSFTPAVVGDYLRVGQDGVNSQANNVSWDEQYNGPWDSAVINFDIRIGKAETGGGGLTPGDPAVNDLADGFGFKWINSANNGTSGAFYTAGEEPNLAGALGVGFDIWNNGAAIDNNANTSISLHSNGSLIKTVNLQDAAGEPTVTAPFSLETGEPINVTIAVTAGTPDTGQMARTDVLPTSSYATSATRSPPVGGLTGVADNPALGVQEGFYRLTDQTNDQGNYITWDAVPGAGSRPGFGARTGGANHAADLDNVNVDYSTPGTIAASFSARLTKDAGAPADGLSFVLASTVDHGTTGVVDQVTSAAWAVAEDPNLEGSIGIAFKTFGDQEFRVTFDGTRIATIPNPGGTFVDGEWHDVTLTVVDDANGVDALLVWTVDGNVIYNDTIAGAAGLGIPIPEPATATLLVFAVLGAAGFTRRRRR